MTGFQSSSFQPGNFQPNHYDQNNYHPFNFNQNTHGQQQQHDFQTQNGYQTGQVQNQAWSGVSLKHIMGQLDFINASAGCNWTQKWSLCKEATEIVKAPLANTKQGNYLNYQEKPMPVDPTMPQMIYKTPKMDFKQNNEENAAWLGPQLWSRKLPMDFKNNENYPQSEFSSDSPMSDKSESLLDWYQTEPETPMNQDLIQAENPNDDFSAADIALASNPGGSFDPRTRCFSPEELKPLPVIRKRSKTYTLDREKTEDYWAKRVKNNVAARKSREAKRVKENQIALRTAYLEKENSNFRVGITKMKKENKETKQEVDDLKSQIRRYENMERFNMNK